MNMKKLTSIMLATCIVGSLFAFSGCGNATRSGAVRGDYTEITSENQEQAIEDIIGFEEAVAQTNNGGLFGDTANSKWSYGVTFATGLKIDYNMENYAKGSLDLDSEFAVAMYKQKSDVMVKGNGELKFNFKNTLQEDYDYMDMVTDLKMEAKASMFDGYAYADVKLDGQVNNEAVAEELNEIAGKVTYDALEDFLGEKLGGFDLGNLGNSNSIVSLATVVEKIQDSGLPVSYELSEKSGLKLKVSITEDMVEKLVGALTSNEDVSFAMSMHNPALDIKTCKLDLYIVISETGLLKQVSVDLNLDMKIPDETGKSYLKIKGAIVMKGDTAVKVTIDTSKKINPKYEDYSDFLFMM